MTANDRRYEDFLHFMPEEEQENLEKALSDREEEESRVDALIRFQSRERSRKLGDPTRA